MAKDHSNKLAWQKTYVDLMEEIKFRHAALNPLMQAESIPWVVRRESSFLQLRLMCELIALGCLVAHGDMPAIRAKRLHQRWEADYIIKAMEKLHANFYPRPVKIIVQKNDEPAQLAPITDEPYLTKEMLIKLHHRCGEVLHRGRLEKVQEKRAGRSGMQEVVDSDKLIVRLLNYHHIQPIDSNYQYLIAMESPDHGGQVFAATASAIPTDGA